MKLSKKYLKEGGRFEFGIYGASLYLSYEYEAEGDATVNIPSQIVEANTCIELAQFFLELSQHLKQQKEKSK